jgi:ATP-binding cassette subfamily F protein 3
LVFISHDPTFLTRLATRIVEIDNGSARNYLGDYEYYLWKRAQELDSIKGNTEEAAAAIPKKGKKAKGPDPAPPPLPAQELRSTQAERRDLSKTQARLEKQVSRAETEIAELEARIKERDLQLADPNLYEDYNRWHELHDEHARWKAEMDRLTAKWEGLSKELEEVKQKLTTAG